LQEMDVVIAGNGRPLRDARALTDAIQATGVGKPLVLTILRDGRAQEITLVPGPRRPESNREFYEHLDRRIAAETKAGDTAVAAGTRLEAFSHYVRALQFLHEKNSEDEQDLQINGLLVKLAALQAQMRVPAEADRHNRRAIAILQSARTPEDNDRAYHAFNDALFDAPWIPDLWLNAGLVLEKAGYPEGARIYLRRAVLLDPEGPDAPAIRRQIAALDVLVEERRPWLAYVGTYTFANKTQERITLRGRDLVVTSVSGSTEGSGRNDKPGDVLARATINGRSSGIGKWTDRPVNPNEVRCFGAVNDKDAEFRIEDRKLVIMVTQRTFVGATCEITARNPVSQRRYGAGN
jgi:tetratricopeptide (TPR) repeat protein